ncbi:3-hydroxybutyryl-CoA dehydrogenase [Thermosporothrix hazakensis]|jgi:3-hydroxybutyryl-CoA dehydrogenase|uniref:3-hydroxybutyryl-CoA dehydrogenase n=1 Tax=Thermosporothrix hazakensis TaxID=644383 RepID=A0A326U8N1_THEHA|nr:3-hydroxybutyryl-CoA dehydrogenase [Thermosporothrix hazakensis]PZW32101.1 3-hydroxybutyryl-CoA dehydrogenase [Thermosporothrix hazakensis]GCE49571.1 3-hydroxybutyryl-CoA dehydrogenase [Thermosporothrix hazakensis]
MAIRKAGFKVGVIGCGLMGSGIAQTCAQSGYETVVREVNQELLDKGLARIYSAWEMMVNKGKITQGQADEHKARLHGTVRLEDLADCDIVIEAIIENMEEKLRLFPALDAILKPEALILSNTSSLNITQMGAVTKRPEQVCGLHFFNPAPVMKLVEIVKTLSTSEQTIETVREFAISLGKTPVLAKDTAGFIVNFLLIPYLLAAIRMLENGMASREDIDTAMKYGCGYPMGPLTLLDYVGLDTTLWAAEAIYEEYKEPLYAPPPLLRRMVNAGMLGRKSGKGFYDYSETK